MTADLYQQAKAVFSELLALDPDDQARRLNQLQQQSPELEQEVRSLLEYHTAQSLIAPQSTPKIRTRSTLSTTYHSRSIQWLDGPLKGLLCALPLFLLGLLLAAWIDDRMHRQLKVSVAGRLSDAIEVRVKEFGLRFEPTATAEPDWVHSSSVHELLKGWSSDSRDCYLLNDRGAIVAGSRYATQLVDLPLARDRINEESLPLARDPGVDLIGGQQPNQPSAAWLPTLLARQVTTGNNGVYVEGYRNYVGQSVVGVWRWLPQFKVGLAIEENHAEAFALATNVRNGIMGCSGLFAASLISFAVAIAYRDRSRRLRTISEVGAYQIQELLGEGGMGRVYLAEHALLCRQSAIKVLTKGDNDLSVISRFEREVQLASQLTHPNTIAIYDFGRSREGVFYYAMEYINGAHLGQLVEYSGPVEPGRCIHLLKQLCRALLEAHQAGVVHRDVKPQNIMVCNRGGEPDFVKLFDYGLVKAFAPGVELNSSQTKVVVGTPRFMAPERLNSPWLADPRVDVYSVGALAYYLLTAQLPPLVTSGDEIENDQPGVETLDLPPGVVDFGGMLCICMSVEPASRPSSMSSLLRELDNLEKKFPWSRADSELWWSKHEDKLLRLVKTKRKRLSPDVDKLWRK